MPLIIMGCSLFSEFFLSCDYSIALSGMLFYYLNYGLKHTTFNYDRKKAISIPIPLCLISVVSLPFLHYNYTFYTFNELVLSFLL